MDASDRDHPARRLRPLLQPAAVRAGGQRDRGQVRQHHGGLAQFRGHHALFHADQLFRRGRSAKLGALTLGVDAYYRQDRNLIDEGQFGAPIILTPFNYAKGYARGIEFTANYVHGPFSVYGNLAISKAQGQDIDSSQFNFDPGDLAYIATHYIYLDHNQTITASAGASYRLGDTHLNADLIIGSGLRRDGDVPNGDHVPAYTQVNFSIVHDFRTAATGPFSLRLDLINAFDEVYQIRDGTGVGVGAPQFGPRRGCSPGSPRASDQPRPLARAALCTAEITNPSVRICGSTAGGPPSAP